MIRAKQAYREDQTKTYKNALAIAIVLSVAFLIMQIIAWQQMMGQSVFVSSNNSAGYLYLLSGLHLFHVFGGIPFLVYFLHQARQEMKEQVSVLVYFSDPERRLKLHLLTIYWHFMDALWLFLIVFFYLIYWTQ